jgi:hypothetical protein
MQGLLWNRHRKTALSRVTIRLKAGCNYEGGISKIFFASTSTCYDPIQATQERGAPVRCGITVIKITVVTALVAVGPRDTGWVPVLVPVLGPKTESMLKEQTRMQAQAIRTAIFYS